MWYYTFHFSHIILLFTIIVLIDVVLFTTILLQIFTNVVSVVVDEEPNLKQWFMLLGVDVICCVVILPIIWSMELLTETSKTDRKASRNLSIFATFTRFRFAVLIYLGFTRLIPSLLRIITSCEYRWMSNGAEETGNLVFVIFMFYMFIHVEGAQKLS
jgi:uncharacterized membrane protein